MKRSGFSRARVEPMRRRTRLRAKRRKSGVTGRPSVNTRQWLAMKRELWVRAGGRCEACRLNPAVDADHVKKRSQGGADNLDDNLVALCRDCHRAKDRPFVKGRLVIVPLGKGKFQFEWHYTAPSASVSDVERNATAAATSKAAGPSRPGAWRETVVIAPRSDPRPTVPRTGRLRG